LEKEREGEREREREIETGVETDMHEEPLGDAARQREGRVVDKVMDNVKYPGIN
jgi:hypothetical protein